MRSYLESGEAVFVGFFWAAGSSFFFLGVFVGSTLFLFGFV